MRNTLAYFLMLFLDFEEHLKVISTKINKAIGLLRKLQKVLLRPVLKTIYKAFVRPYLDIGEEIFDEACNKTFQSFHYWRDSLCQILLKANVATDECNSQNEIWTLNKEMKLE